MTDRPQINYTVDPNTNPSTWPDGTQPAHPLPHSQGHAGPFTDVPKCQVTYINIDHDASDLRVLHTGTNGHHHGVLLQVAKHVSRGLCEVDTMTVTKYSCTVVVKARRSREELLFKSGFPWDGEHDPQPEVVLK